MNFSIIIVNYNTKQLLKNCLDSIYAQKNIDLEVIVVDNNSSDGSGEIIKRYFPGVKLIENDTNVGFGKANNQGASIASGNFLLFMNSDTIMHNDTLGKIIDCLEKQMIDGAIGFKILNTDHSLQPSCGNFPTLLNLTAETLFLDRVIKFRKPYHILDAKKYQNKFEPNWVSGSFLAVSRDAFNAVRGFDENFFLYVEEVDLCYRIRKKGYSIAYLPCVSITHNNRASSKSKKTAIILTHHNLLYYIHKHYNLLFAVQIYLLFILKSAIYSILGLLLGIFNRDMKDKGKDYFFLLISLISKSKYRKYEDTIKQSN